jgi:hypothetical protein
LRQINRDPLNSKDYLALGIGQAVAHACDHGIIVLASNVNADMHVGEPFADEERHSACPRPNAFEHRAAVHAGVHDPQPIGVVATALGRPVYDRLGYRPLGTLQMWERRPEQ